MYKKQNYIVVAAIFFAVIITTTIVFFSYLQNDNFGVYGSQNGFLVTSLPQNISKQQFSDEISKIAEKEHINIYYFTQGSENGGNSKNVLSFLGNIPEYNKLFPGGEYPNFTMGWSTKLINSSQINNQTLLGTYFTSATDKQLNTLIELFKSLNISASGFSTNSFSIVFYAFMVNNLYFLFLAMIIALCFTVAFITIKESPTYAIMISNGFGIFKILYERLKNLIIEFLSVFIISTIALLIFCKLYNNLNQFSSFFNWYLVGCGALLITILIIETVIFLALPKRKKLIEFIKGKSFFGYLRVLSTLAQIIILIVLFNYSTNSFANIKAVSQNLTGLEAYKNIKGYQFITSGFYGIRGFVDNEDRENFHKMINNVLSKNGLLISKKYESFDNLYTKKHNTLIVNNLYLQKQTIYDQNNKPIPASENEYILSIPESHMEDTKELKVAAEDKLNEWINEGEKSENFNIRVVYQKEGQTLSNFNNGLITFSSLTKVPDFQQTDPLVLILPNHVDNRLIGRYGVWINNGQAYYAPNIDVPKLYEKYNVSSYYTAVNNVTEAAYNEVANLEQQIQTDLFGLIISLTVLLFSNIILVMLYFNKNKKIIFARITNGFGFLITHLGFIAQAIILPFLVFGIFSYAGIIQNIETIIICLSFVLISIFAEIIAVAVNQKNIGALAIKQ